ncbi:interferon-induced GTP-binding protein Mx2 [Suncus etruscus]|uniref:interferon-induced GTP-binding protein Mx2 n=1 Tax=Suncus etruscus TaxID=109475 RepID=UPI002110B18B|nr:interferon-induced GTP-binding protein Mx2 [Suncus etruscus]
MSQHQQLNPGHQQFNTGGQKGAPETKDPKNTLFSQYEEKMRPCIDLIDSLRALGVEQDLALPSIAVIGDQSSGKSSVLEALSGVALPRGSGIVTRCPLVLKLKKVPAGGTWSGQVSYRDTHLKLDHPSQVEREICRAQDIIAGKGVGISHELISLYVNSPRVPDLTIIDLPGIARIPVGNQPADIATQIKGLIQKYIQSEQTINLVVIPCNVDIATTEALSMAHMVDPEGDRTIGILTKPDLVDKGTEANILNVAKNLTYRLKKGFMMVRCRGQQEIMNRLSLTEATKNETEFFQTHPYFRTLLDEGLATMPCLAKKLTSELILHINKSLPYLENQIRESHQQATNELSLCGTNVPNNSTERMMFLIDKVKKFQCCIQRLVDGEEVLRKKEIRLCNLVRETFADWDKVLHRNMENVKGVMHDEVSKYEKRYRGNELPGFINYKTFEFIVQEYIDQLVQPAVDMLQKAIGIIYQSFADAANSEFGEFINLNQIVQKLIEDIKVKQADIAEDQIRLQFRMERHVFCQDHIYSSILSKVREEMFLPTANPLQRPLKTPSLNNSSKISTIAEIGVHLNAYFLETSQRLANQIPIQIRHFMLYEYGDCLQKSMMQILQDKNSFSWLLQEQNETMAKREFLKEKIHRLTKAREALFNFSCS